MPVPTAEKPPEGLNAYWLGVWRHALKTLKSQGSWAWEQKPLLDEYVYAWIGAERGRREGETKVWDGHAKRAAALADQLALTPRGRKAISLKGESDDDEQGADPFARLDELAPRRQAKGG